MTERQRRQGAATLARPFNYMIVGMGGRRIMLTAAVLLAACGFLPWLRSGQRERSGFELLDAARSLDVLGPTTLRALAFGLYLLPLAAALCWLAALLEWPKVAAAVGVAAGLLGGLPAVAMEQADIPTLVGVRIGWIAAAAIVAAAVVELFKSGHYRNDVGQPEPSERVAPPTS